MDFFDRMGEKLVTAGKDVTQKAKDLSGTAKLNFDIKAKEDFIEKQYAQIGKLYYEDHKEEADGAYGQLTMVLPKKGLIVAVQCPESGDLNKVKPVMHELILSL